jgi:hypothetical protein
VSSALLTGSTESIAAPKSGAKLLKSRLSLEPADLPTSKYVTHRFGEAQLSDPEKSFEPCCKDMTTAMSFPAGRHFFVENGVLMLTVARAILNDGSEGILEHPVRFCPFCGKPVQDRSERPL